MKNLDIPKLAMSAASEIDDALAKLHGPGGNDPASLLAFVWQCKIEAATIIERAIREALNHGRDSQGFPLSNQTFPASKERTGPLVMPSVNYDPETGMHDTQVIPREMK